MNLSYMSMIKLIKKLRMKCRHILMTNKRKSVLNKDISILCNNCVGAMVLHDLGLRFNSPTVNLWFQPSNYIMFLESLLRVSEEHRYNESFEKGIDYPIMTIDDRITVYLKHYPSFEKALEKWNQRIERINFSNLLVVLVERDGCTYEDLKKFESLPYKNKIALVHKSYEDIHCSFVVPSNRSDFEVDDLTEWAGMFGKGYDKIDWVNIINKTIEKL